MGARRVPPGSSAPPLAKSIADTSAVAMDHENHLALPVTIVLGQQGIHAIHPTQELLGSFLEAEYEQCCTSGNCHNLASVYRE
jgi:hypothetical protein